MIIESDVTARLKADEGFVPHAYNDHLGFATVGFGRLIDKRRGGGITRQEAEYLLRNDIYKCAAECESRFEWWDALDDVRQGAIVCMAYQLGTSGVANFKRMIAAIKRRDWVTVEKEALDSTWSKQTPARARRMARILKTGVWE